MFTWNTALVSVFCLPLHDYSLKQTCNGFLSNLKCHILTEQRYCYCRVIAQNTDTIHLTVDECLFVTFLSFICLRSVWRQCFRKDHRSQKNHRSSRCPMGRPTLNGFFLQGVCSLASVYEGTIIKIYFTWRCDTALFCVVDYFDIRLWFDCRPLPRYTNTHTHTAAWEEGRRETVCKLNDRKHLDPRGKTRISSRVKRKGREKVAYQEADESKQA